MALPEVVVLAEEAKAIATSKQEIADFVEADKNRKRSAIMFRAMDLLGALVGLLLAAPIMLVAALAVWLTMGAPVLFRQRRLGRYELPFILLKFRTMRPAKDQEESSSDRLTRVGRFLRQLSIDELPQLWNVLKGEMSLVGPRPLYPEYLPYYTPRERRRHLVRPGITGLSQVSGRNRSPWDDRLELDVQYVARKSLWLDLSIILKTFAKVIQRSDVMERAVQGSLIKHRQKQRPLL